MKRNLIKNRCLTPTEALTEPQPSSRGFLSLPLQAGDGWGEKGPAPRPRGGSGTDLAAPPTAGGGHCPARCAHLQRTSSASDLKVPEYFLQDNLQTAGARQGQGQGAF